MIFVVYFISLAVIDMSFVLFSCTEVKLGLLRCTGLLENNIKALLNLHGAD